jgi:hypothetical protein
VARLKSCTSRTSLRIATERLEGLAAFGMKDMVNLRIVAICSNIAFITYALVLNLLPVLILHVVLLPLNGWRLMEALKQSGATTAGRSIPDFIVD